MSKMSISSILRGAFYERILSTIGVASVIGYSTYIISHYEQIKMDKTNQLFKKTVQDYKLLEKCNQNHSIQNEKDTKILINPNTMIVHGECSNLHDIYKKSYNEYERNKYNISSKYII
jgi:hypothetical protein